MGGCTGSMAKYFYTGLPTTFGINSMSSCCTSPLIRRSHTLLGGIPSLLALQCKVTNYTLWCCISMDQYGAGALHMSITYRHNSSLKNWKLMNSTGGFRFLKTTDHFYKMLNWMPYYISHKNITKILSPLQISKKLQVSPEMLDCPFDIGSRQ